jgi:hypothetical protein
MMCGAIRITFSICLIFSGLLLLSSCNRALHNKGRTAFIQQQIEIRDTSPDMKLWQTDHLVMKYRLKDIGSSFTISGTVHIKDRVTLSFPISDFLYIYVNLLDQNGMVSSKHDICPCISRYNTVPDQIMFNKTLQKNRDTTSIAFSYWGNFREKGITSPRNVVDLEIFFNPFERRD